MDSPTFREATAMVHDLPLQPVSWVEVSASALAHNVQQLRQAAGTAGRQPLLCVMVKGNAYGHGLVQAARSFVQAGVEWLGVHDVFEVMALREAGVQAAIYVVGHLPPHQVETAVRHGARFVLYDREVMHAAEVAAHKLGTLARVHVKVETGNNRQGLRHAEAVALCREIAALPHVQLEGMTTHFADIEDTTDHRFAHTQLARFQACVLAVREALALPPEGHDDDRLLAHVSNTAAILLWPEVCGKMARCGIGAYGLWPSKETYISVRELGKEPIELRPALTWKTVIAQVRDVPAGEWIGYGRTFRAVRPTRVAILPVGYYDGYDRGLSNLGKVLVDGWRAPVVGRVAMNMTAIDVTDRPEARAGTEVVLLGAQTTADGTDGDCVTAEEMAGWAGTIHYETVTRISERLERRLVP
jgi:alanine racemase